MRLENLKVGRGLEIFVTRAGYRYRLVSTIEHVETGKVYITLIASGNKVFRFLDTDQVDIVYRDETHLIQWENIKGSVESLDNTKMHCFLSNKEGTNFNRRQVFRVEIDEDIEVCLFQHKEETEKAEKNETTKETEYDEYGNEVGTVSIEKFDGILKNASENGVGFYTNRVLNIGDEIGFSLLTTFGTMYFKCQIVRHMEHRSGKFREFYGCILIRSDKSFGKYLFALQRMRLHKQR